ncbi:hypothetical protein HPB50_013776 [Hyalomma asiaticum]|uniref:Uncharacterized protein n=1 Tax=Hyalomma asiaticum TaxID=266040 RepID=A0ACB7THF8_HYAAI|nr:hypothetical protein HPB50_013776 [Hyalomma asiaticum]
MLQGNSDLEHNNLALSRDDDTENHEFSNAEMDSAEAGNTCVLQEKTCCSCRQELVKVQQQLKEATSEILRLKTESQEHHNCSTMLAKIKSEVQQKSTELASKCEELKNSTDMLTRARLDLARAKEETVSLSRINEQQMNEHTATIQELESQLSCANDQKWKFCIERFREDDSSMQFYTGLPNYGHFKKLLQLVAPKSDSTSSSFPKNVRGRRCKLSLEDQLFLTLIKLRVGLFHIHLAHIFDISPSTVSRVFTTWIKQLYEILTDMPWWPERDVVDLTMPEEFKQKYPKTRLRRAFFLVPEADARRFSSEFNSRGSRAKSFVHPVDG